MPSINKYLLSGFYASSGITDRVVGQCLQNAGPPEAFNLLGLGSEQMHECLIWCLVVISVMGKIKQGEYTDSDGGVSGYWGKASEVRERAARIRKKYCKQRSSWRTGCLDHIQCGCSHACSDRSGRECSVETSRGQITSVFADTVGSLHLCQVAWESIGETWSGFKGRSWETVMIVPGRDAEGPTYKSSRGDREDGRLWSFPKCVSFK